MFVLKKEPQSIESLSNIIEKVKANFDKTENNTVMTSAFREQINQALNQTYSVIQSIKNGVIPVLSEGSKNLECVLYFLWIDNLGS